MTLGTELRLGFAEAREVCDRSSRLILLSHEFTDGDDLGAMLALGRALKKQGKTLLKVARGGIPDNLLFLPGQSEVLDKLPENFPEFDALLTLGCGTLQRTGFAELERWAKPIINIDHHPDTQRYGTVNLCEAAAAATCELVYFMLKDWGLEIDKFMATSLLTGIFTDTGGFRHANVTAQILEIAADLLRKGAKLNLISRFTFSQKDLPKLRAWALALENAQFDLERKMVYTVITAEDLARVQAKEEDLDGVVELLNTIPDAKFSMLLKQRGDEIKGSLRSEPYKGVDVSEIARTFGGGGHKLAAGFKFKGHIEKTAEGWRIS